MEKKISMNGEDAAMHVLIVEDNESVCSMLEMFFMKEDFQATFVADGLEAYSLFQKKDWDLLIVDWMIPGMDGIKLCQKIRESSDVPIIMLTAKDSEADQVLGLEIGADDYVTKPFSPLTLIARMKAVVRRLSKKQVKNEINHFHINEETREVFLDGEKVGNLTPKEFELLVFFTKHPRQVFRREQLLERIWGYQFYGDERTVDVHIKRLRKKISTDSHIWIHTVWGVGYKFDEVVAGCEKG